MPNPLVDAFQMMLNRGDANNPFIKGITAGTMGGAVPQATPPPTVASTPPLLPQSGNTAQPTTKDRPNINYGELLKFLVPAATAAVGTAAPNALPMAAGFQEGFVESTQESKTKPFVIVDPDNPQQPKVIQVPKDAIVQQENKGGFDIGSLVQEALNVPQQKTGDAAKKAKEQAKQVYSAGDKRIVNGTTYIRNENGQWQPER